MFIFIILKSLKVLMKKVIIDRRDMELWRYERGRKDSQQVVGVSWWHWNGWERRSFKWCHSPLGLKISHCVSLKISDYSKMLW